MGYLINNSLQKVKVEISAANVATLDTNPVQVVNSAILTDYCIVAATISMKNQIGNVQNFGHFYLINGYALSGNRMGVYDEQIGIPSTTKTINFLINCSHPPNRFGSVSEFTSDLTIQTELPPTATGDIIVTLYYFKYF